MALPIGKGKNNTLNPASELPKVRAGARLGCLVFAQASKDRGLWIEDGILSPPCVLTDPFWLLVSAVLLLYHHIIK